MYERGYVRKNTHASSVMSAIISNVIFVGRFSLSSNIYVYIHGLYVHICGELNERNCEKGAIQKDYILFL